jgi:hypothetical protein
MAKKIATLVKEHGRQAVIQGLVDEQGMTPDRAEFLVGMELGENSGDLILVDEQGREQPDRRTYNIRKLMER